MIHDKSWRNAWGLSIAISLGSLGTQAPDRLGALPLKTSALRTIREQLDGYSLKGRLRTPRRGASHGVEPGGRNGIDPQPLSRRAFWTAYVCCKGNNRGPQADQGCKERPHAQNASIPVALEQQDFCHLCAVGRTHDRIDGR